MPQKKNIPIPTSRKISIRECNKSDEKIILELLLDLDAFHENITAPKQRILRQNKDTELAYKKYLKKIFPQLSSKWQILLAEHEQAVIGLVIGKIKIEKDDLLPKTGCIEDLFVREKFRRQKIAHELVTRLEKWFKEKGCQKMHSDAYFSNQSSRTFHLDFGFSNWGISFMKKI